MKNKKKVDENDITMMVSMAIAVLIIIGCIATMIMGICRLIMGC